MSGVYNLKQLRALAEASGFKGTDEQLLMETARRSNSEPAEVARYFGYDMGGKWGNRFSAGVDSYQANLSGLGEAVFGSDTLGRWRQENEAAASLQRDIARSQGAISSYKDVGSFGDALDYVGGLAVDSSPYILESVAGGGVAGLLSKGLRSTINAGRAIDASADTVRAAQAARNSLGLRAAGGGAVASYPSAVGDILQNQREASPDGSVDLLSAFAGGVPYAALNMFGVEGLAARGTLGRGIRALDNTSGFRGGVQRGLTSMGLGAVTEGASETGQEVLNQYFGRMAVDPNATLTDPDAIERYKESFIGGAALGGAFSGMGGWRRSQEYQDNAQLQQAVLMETRARAAQEQQQKDLLDPARPENMSPEEVFIGGLPTFQQTRPTPAAPSFADFYGGPVDDVRDPYSDIIGGGIAKASEQNIDLPRQVTPPTKAELAETKAEEKAAAKAAKDAERAAKAEAKGRAKTLLGYNSDKAVETLQALDTALAEGRITQEQHEAAANSMATAANTRVRELARQNAMKLVTAPAAPTAPVTQPAPEAVANVSVPDAPGFGPGVGGTQGGPVDSGSVAAAGPVPVAGDGAPGVPGVAQPGVAEAQPGGADVQLAGTPALTEQAPAAPVTGGVFGATREDELNNLLVDRNAGGYRVQLVGAKNVKLDLGGIALSDLPGDATSATAASVDEAKALLAAKLQKAIPAVRAERAAKEATSLTRTAPDGKTVVDMDKLKAAIELGKYDHRFFNAVVHYLGIDPETGRFTGKKGKSAKASAAAAGIGENSGSRLNDLLNKKLKLDGEWRAKFWADNSAAAAALTKQEEAELGVTSEELENANLSISSSLGGSGLKETSIENSWWFKGLPKIEEMNGFQVAYALQRAMSYSAETDGDAKNGAIQDALAARAKQLAAIGRLTPANVTAADKRIKSENATKAKGDVLDTEAYEEVDAEPAEDGDVADAGAEEGGRVSDAADSGSPVGEEAAKPAPVVTTKKKRTIVKPSKTGGASGSTVASVKKEIAGLGLNDKYGKVIVVQSVKDLPVGAQQAVEKESETGGRVQAFVLNGRAYFVADGIAPGTARAVFMHEVGSHLGIDNLLTKAQYDNLVRKILSWSDAAEDTAERRLARRAIARAGEAKTPDVDLHSEVVAYFIEEAVKAGIDPTAMKYSSDLGRWMAELVRGIKQALRRLGLFTAPELTGQDIVDLAYGAANLQLSTDELIDGETDAQSSVLAAPKEFEGRGVKLAFPEPADRFEVIPDSGQQVYNYAIMPTDRFDVLGHVEILIDENGDPLSLLDIETYGRNKGAGENAIGALLLSYPDRDIEISNVVEDAQGFWEKLGVPRQNVEAGAAYSGMLNLKTYRETRGSKAKFSVTSPEFKEWFGDSKVVDKNGKPLVVYHGTQADFSTFELRDAVSGRYMGDGFYFGDAGTASQYSLNEPGSRVMPVYLSIQKPFDWDYGRFTPQQIAAMKKVPGFQEALEAYQEEFAGSGRAEGDIWIGRVAVLMSDAGNGKFGTVIRKLLEAAGYDGVMQEEGEWVAFRPEQIKSATGNNGQYSKKNPDIRFSVTPPPAPPAHVTGTTPLSKSEQLIRSLPAKLRPSARAVMQLLRGAGRKVLNTMAFTDDLLDRAASMGIKSAEKYKELARTRAAAIGHHERMILDAVTGYNNLDDSLKGKDGPVNQYLWKTTTREAWGFQPDWLTEKVTIDPEMEKAFKALPAPAQKVVQDMLRNGAETLRAKKQLVVDMMQSEYDALIAAETDPKEKAALEADKAAAIKSSYGSLMRLADNKPYAPIKRFGSHVVIAKSQEYLDAEANEDRKLMRELESQEQHYYVDFAEGEIAADAIERQLKAKPNYAFTQYREIEAQRNELYGGSKTLKAIGDLKAKIDGMPNSAERKELARMLQEMYLLQLGEDSARKSEMARRNIAGDIDMIRSFETQGLADARFMGQIQYGQPMLEVMNEMRKQVKAGGDANAKSEVFNELIKRHIQAMDYEPTPVINALTRMSSMWFLATSPSYYLQNSTQPWMMSLPFMAAKHDYAKMAPLLTKAYGEIWGPLKDAKMFGQLDFNALLDPANAKLTKGEKAMIRALLDANRIDIGMANEIGQITAEADKASVKNAYAKVDNSLRGLQQKLEAVNRLTTALAAYRAEIADGSSEAVATAYADEVIQRTHGDYSSWNAPRAFNTRGGKIMLQFRKYQLIQLTMMAKLFNNSFSKNSDEAKVARKALRNMMAQAFIVGGGKAMPFGAAAAFVFSKLFGDDDEPPEMTFRKMVGNEDIADMLLYGAPAVAGINGAPYGGWGNSTSVLPFVDLDLSSRKGVAEAGYALLAGPFGGLTLRAADGIGYMQNGDYWRGLENLLPKGFTNFSKAIREETEGTTNKRGDQLLTPDEVGFWNSLQQSMGVTPLSATKRMVASDQLYNTRTDVKAEGSRIKKDFLEARRSRDTAGMAEARKEWMEYQNKRARLGFERQSLSELMKAGDQQKTREQLSRGGVQYRKGEADFAEELAVGDE